MGKSVGAEQIASAILVLRGHRVLLDAELAALYDVTTKRLNEQVKRNAARFPADFIFRLTPTETVALNRSQNAAGSQKHREYSAYVEKTSSLRSQIATLKTGRHRNEPLRGARLCPATRDARFEQGATMKPSPPSADRF
jgi:ORF6N domain